MKITNKHGLPDVVVNAVKAMIREPSDEAIHVTQLIQPPIVRQLKKRHWSELEEDASDAVWRLFGTAVHEKLATLSPDNVVENRVEAVIDGVTVRGTPDVADGELSDYKVTSVWHKVFADGLPDDWCKQLNVYAYLLGNIKKATIIAIYRDWHKSKAARDADYPPRPMMHYDLPLSSKGEQEAYIKKQIKAHKEAEKLPDDALPICSPEDRWATKTTYAIYKNQNKTATRVVDSPEEAEKIMALMAEKMPKHEFRIEERPGVDKRCQSYCPVQAFCRHGKKLQGEDNNE